MERLSPHSPDPTRRNTAAIGQRERHQLDWPGERAVASDDVRTNADQIVGEISPATEVKAG